MISPVGSGQMRKKSLIGVRDTHQARLRSGQKTAKVDKKQTITEHISIINHFLDSLQCVIGLILVTIFSNQKYDNTHVIEKISPFVWISHRPWR
jgi:hypothetical protein